MVPYVNDYLQVVWMLWDSGVAVWIGAGKYVRLLHIWRKGGWSRIRAKAIRGRAGREHPAESNPARFGDPKPKAMRHAGVFQRVNGSPRAALLLPGSKPRHTPGLVVRKRGRMLETNMRPGRPTR